MNTEYLFEQIEKLPTSIKKLIYSTILASSMSFKGIEKEMFEVEAIPDSIEQTKQIKSSLSQMFKEGIHNEQTKEYRDRFYKILQLADVKAERFRQEDFSNNTSYQDNGLFQKLNENNDYLMKNEITTIQNKIILTNDYQHHVLKENPIYGSSIKIGRTNDTNHKIEMLTDVLHVKKMNGSNNMYELKFIINLDKNSKKTISDSSIIALTNITSVSFFKNYNTENYSIVSFVDYEMKNDQVLINFMGRK